MALIFALAGCNGASVQTGNTAKCAPTPTITTSQLLSINVNSYSIAVGPDGYVWARKTTAPTYKYELHRFSSNGADDLIPLPFNPGYVSGMISGPDHNLWLTTDTLVRRTSTGQITTFPLTAHSCYGDDLSKAPFNLTIGPDGAIWFTEYGDTHIGRITTQGTITEYALPSPFVHSLDITSGADGNLWFTDELGSNIGRITPNGQVTAFPLGFSNGHPYGIAVGADGNVWFAEPGTARLGKITPMGQIIHYLLPTENSLPIDLVKGPDGNIWFTELQANQIGRITPTGQITEFPTRADHGQPNQLVVGPEGTLWFSSNGDVFRMQMDGTPLWLVNGMWIAIQP
jgi:virginiamycin B lyase